MASGPAVAGLVVGARWGAPVIVKPSSGADEAGGNLADVRRRPGGARRVTILRGRVAAFVAVSHQIATTLVDDWGIPCEQVAQIPNGVELPRWLTAPRTARSVGRRTFLYVGRLNTEKGVDILLRAWGRAQQPGELVIAGDGPLRQELERATPPRVRFLGAVQDPMVEYRRADVFILPSRREGQSNALLEAICAGLPVVATDVGDNRQLLGNSGRLVPAGDVEALAAALLEPPSALANPMKFRERFGIDSVARQHVALYRSLIGQSHHEPMPLQQTAGDFR
jgi:glycosyltransferase involved in cell wall biosynthesis